MRRQLCTMAAMLLGLVLVSGCGSASTGFNIGRNLARKDSNLEIYLDGMEAKQNKFKKGLSGYSAWTVKEPVSTSPTFEYRIADPKKFGFIKHVMMAIHQKFEADFSDIADYVIHSRDTQTSELNLKPDTKYELGSLGDQFRIMDRHDKEVPQVDLRPGSEYLLVFTVVADKSESIQIYFETK